MQKITFFSFSILFFCSVATHAQDFSGYRRGFGIYLPWSVNSLTHFNAGVSLRLGPFFVGTGSGLTALLGDSRQADVHVGLRFGGLYKKVGK